MGQITFLRFVLPGQHPDSGARDGVFGAAYQLSQSGTLPEAQQRELDDLLQWFEEHLDTPTRFNKSRSKGWYRRAPKGISWLKPTAKAHLERLRSLVAILEDHGLQVSMIKTRNPGYVVYEDDYQVVAEPFKDTVA